MDHNYTCHNYIGHNYTRHDYLGHNYIGHDVDIVHGTRRAVFYSKDGRDGTGTPAKRLGIPFYFYVGQRSGGKVIRFVARETIGSTAGLTASASIARNGAPTAKPHPDHNYIRP